MWKEVAWFLFAGTASGVLIPWSECPPTPKYQKFPAYFHTAPWHTLVSVPFSSLDKRDLFVNITAETSASFDTTTLLANNTLRMTIRDRFSMIYSRVIVIPFNRKGHVHSEWLCNGLSFFVTTYKNQSEDVVRLWFDEDFVFVLICANMHNASQDVAVLIFLLSSDRDSITLNLRYLMPWFKEIARKNLGPELTDVIRLGDEFSEDKLNREEQKLIICPSRVAESEEVVTEKKHSGDRYLLMRIIIFLVISCVAVVFYFVFRKL